MGFYSENYYKIKLVVSEEGQLTDINIKKAASSPSSRRAFKVLLPVVAKLLAPITGGLSLVALGVYNAAKAIKNKIFSALFLLWPQEQQA